MRCLLSSRAVIFVTFCLLISVCPTTDAGSSTVVKFKDLFLDLFGLGSDIYSIWKDSTDSTTALVKDVLFKLDVVLDTISNLQDTVTDLFAQQALQTRLSVVEKFHRQTINRVRELDNIVKAKETEKDRYMRLFIDGTKSSSFLDALYDIIPSLIDLPISSDKTVVQLVRDHNRCDNTVVGQFLDLCRRTIYSGIIVEVTFKTHEYNLSLEQEQKDWGKRLQDLEAAVEKMNEHCDTYFPLYYNEDIRQVTALGNLHANLERRYLNISFFGTDLSDDESFYFSASSPPEKLSCFKLPECHKRRCLAYTEINSSCELTPSLQIITSNRELQYKLSADWPGKIFYTTKDGKRTYNLLQVDCSVPASFLEYPEVEMTHTCVSGACRLPVSTLLAFTAVAMLKTLI